MRRTKRLVRASLCGINDVITKEVVVRFSKLTGGFCVLFLSFAVSGCATIVSGTTQKISVTSQPSEAIAKVDNNTSSKTPASFTLDRKNDHTIEIAKDGYKTATVLIKRSLNGMAFGNVLIGGIIGGGVDMVSGANNKLIPERVDVVLEEGTGYSDVPKFASAKDAEFYEKNVLKPSQKAPEKTTPAPMAANTVQPQTGTNFSPATKTV